MTAYVTICGRTYEVLSNALAEVRVEENCEDCKVPQLPIKADLSRKPGLAGQTVDQKTKTGTYAVTYDADGYAIEAKKLEVQ